ncbi:MAG TPA: hypothetical protein VFU69_07860, partial [Ktedonobacterales bacterium]|nr:hypothetical protein [Ktedonobacterales bacterium]
LSSMVHDKKRWVAGLISGITVCAMIAAGFLVFGHAAAAGGPPVLNIDDSNLQAQSLALGGADALPTTRTIPHFHGTAVNPNDGINYGFNMVGADPNNCSGADCSVTIEADITPIIVNFGGQTFSGEDVLGPTLASPVFATNDYGTTPFATNGDALLTRGAGGALSQGDAGIPLQFEDANMRAQFNKTGADSNYHLILHPNIMPTVTFNVPDNQGVFLVSGRGVVFPDINIQWWSAQLANLVVQSDPTHLPIFLTNGVMLFTGGNPQNCCVFGFHGTKAVGQGIFHGGAGTSSNGNDVVQTFVWTSWATPGIFARPNGGRDWALQDISGLTHEISEWADDPYILNLVQPWTTGGLPCQNNLETGDPVVAVGFAMSQTNTFDQGPNPNGTQSADGYYHPEDQAFLPWFMRTTPNTISEPTQVASTNVGRYTFMGSLNQFPDFTHGAPTC